MSDDLSAIPKGAREQIGTPDGMAPSELRSYGGLRIEPDQVRLLQTPLFKRKVGTPC